MVAQLGARLHYGAARAFFQRRMLECLYTDICVSIRRQQLIRSLPWVPPPLARLGERIPVDVPEELVRTFMTFGLRYAWCRSRVRDSDTYLALHLWAGQTFCKKVLKKGFDGASVVYTFNTAALEILGAARNRGALAVVEQTIVPTVIERALLDTERSNFPHWDRTVPATLELHEEFAAREFAEWRTADTIVCGSPFVAESIAACGGPGDRCAVVPYGYSNRRGGRIRHRPHYPLRVLTVGLIGLRKGTPYVLRAAKKLRGCAVFRLIGPRAVSDSVIDDLRTACELVGSIPRDRVEEHYQWADVFLLPSICEGSATVCYEALAAGLPVVTTYNSGSVVRDGTDGFVVALRSPDAIIAALESIATNDGLLETLSMNALRRSAEYSLDKYADRLASAMTSPRLDEAGSTQWIR